MRSRVGRKNSIREILFNRMRWNTRTAATVSGIRLIARNRQFENDRSPVSTVKGVNRAMAGEYSREFSARVFNGQRRLIEFGSRQSGPAGYGWSFCALHARSNLPPDGRPGY